MQYEALITSIHCDTDPPQSVVTTLASGSHLLHELKIGLGTFYLGNTAILFGPVGG